MDTVVVSERERERAYAHKDSEVMETQTRCQDRSQRRPGRRRGGRVDWHASAENLWKVVRAALGLVHGEGGGADGLDPCGVARRVLRTRQSVSRTRARRTMDAHLPGHDARVPPLALSLRDAGSERRGVHVAVARIGGRSGLADDKLVQFDTMTCNLEQCGFWPGACRSE